MELIKRSACTDKQLNLAKNLIVDKLGKLRKDRTQMGQVSRQPNQVDLGAGPSSSLSKKESFPLVMTIKN